MHDFGGGVVYAEKGLTAAAVFDTPGGAHRLQQALKAQATLPPGIAHWKLFRLQKDNETPESEPALCSWERYHDATQASKKRRCCVVS